jgi:Asp/Glu/hydantoin racemase
MRDPFLLEASLAEACQAAVSEDSTEAIVIGGGPLAVSAASLRSQFSVPIIEPVPAAVRLALRRAGDGDTRRTP